MKGKVLAEIARVQEKGILMCLHSFLCPWPTVLSTFSMPSLNQRRLVIEQTLRPNAFDPFCHSLDCNSFPVSLLSTSLFLLALDCQICEKPMSPNSTCCSWTYPNDSSPSMFQSKPGICLSSSTFGSNVSPLWTSSNLGSKSGIQCFSFLYLPSPSV